VITNVFLHERYFINGGPASHLRCLSYCILRMFHSTTPLYVKTLGMLGAHVHEYKKTLSSVTSAEDPILMGLPARRCVVFGQPWPLSNTMYRPILYSSIEDALSVLFL
jgi:hypothetical protein